MCLITALRRKRQVNLCELETTLIYTASSRLAGVKSRDSVLKKKKIFFTNYMDDSVAAGKKKTREPETVT